MAFGIDFGTTNSAVTYEGNVLLHVGDNKPFPSIVAISKLGGDDDVICGIEAREHRQELAEQDYQVIPSIKRFLGRTKQWNIAGEQWSPVTVAAKLFEALKAHAEKLLPGRGFPDVRLEEAVVAIPVGFRPEKRIALRRAARDAGIRISSFVSEPTAAFFQSRTVLPACSLVAVFDWGGGTLDVSVIRIQGDQVEELATVGLDRAGDDIDLAIANWAHAQIVGGKGPKFDEIPAECRDKMLVACEMAKMNLFDNEEHDIIISGRYGNTQDPPPLSMKRDDLRAILRPFLAEALDTFKSALGNADVDPSGDSLDVVLLVGGSSNLLDLRDMFEDCYPGRIHVPTYGDWAVSQGASKLAGHPGCYRVAQRICLEMSDKSLLDLVDAGDRFDGGHRAFLLGTTSKADAAQLAFVESVDRGDGRIASSNGVRRIGSLSIPMRCFLDEDIDLRCQRTEDLTVRVVCGGLKGGSEDVGIWEYDKVRFTYDMKG